MYTQTLLNIFNQHVYYNPENSFLRTLRNQHKMCKDLASAINKVLYNPIEFYSFQ